MDMQGRKLLVTGGQQGIGRAVAIAFAKAGADVAINYLDDFDAATAVADEVMKLGRKAVLLKADVGDLDGHAGLVAAAVEGLGGLDTLVNNAGVYPRAPFLEMPETVWDQTMTVNLKATAFLTQAFARQKVAAGGPGAVVSMSSLAAQGWPNSAHYAGSKGGIISLTRSMAMELAAYGIRVNAIAPGVIDTAQPRGGYSEEQLAELVKGTLAGRMGHASEVASVAVFLASDAASFVNGQTIHVNGGAFMA